MADQLTVSQVEKFLAGKESGKLTVDSHRRPRPLSDRSVKALRGVLTRHSPKPCNVERCAGTPSP
jgi:uncharacterized protein (UPF0276 family)